MVLGVRGFGVLGFSGCGVLRSWGRGVEGFGAEGFGGLGLGQSPTHPTQ